MLCPGCQSLRHCCYFAYQMENGARGGERGGACLATGVLKDILGQNPSLPGALSIACALMGIQFLHNCSFKSKSTVRIEVEA